MNIEGLESLIMQSALHLHTELTIIIRKVMLNIY